MKNGLVTLLWFLTSFFISHAQVQLQWAKSIGGKSADESRSIAVDASGNVYSTGFYKGTADLDPGTGKMLFNAVDGLFTDIPADIYVSKLDKDGKYIWAKSMGGIYADAGNSIAVDDSGNVFTTGYFRDTADFDPGIGTYILRSVGDDDIFISKLDRNGNFVWAKSIGTDSKDAGNSISVDASGNVYATGLYGGDTSFISKLNNDGTSLWMKFFGGLPNITSNAIKPDKFGNIYLTGSLPKDAISIIPLLIFVAKLNTEGDLLWIKDFGDDYQNHGTSLVVDEFSNVYITGLKESSIFINKLDSAGTTIWEKEISSTARASGLSIAIDNAHNVYTAGLFSGIADFDPGAAVANRTASLTNSLYISKLDASGNYIWSKQLDGYANDSKIAITVDAANTIYATGHFENTVNINPGTGIVNLESSGFSDVFILKLQQVPNSVQEPTSTACTAYPNPITQSLTVEFGRNVVDGKLLLINALGQPVAEQLVVNGNSVVLNTATLSSGLYILELTENGIQSRTKLVKY